MSDEIEQRELDWSNAEVADGELTVPLTGRRSRAWSGRVAIVLAELQNAGNGWESVAVERDRVVVSDLTRHTADEIRFFLESVVQEANATVGDLRGDHREHDRGEKAEARDAGDDADTRLTDVFRAYAEPRADEQPRA